MKYIIILILLFFSIDVSAQNLDAGKPIDSVNIAATQQLLTDSTPAQVPGRLFDSIYNEILRNPYLPDVKNPLFLTIDERHRESKDETFYLLSGMLLFIAFIKFMFPKYFNSIFTLFFQPQFKQKQTREQLLQNNFPSLLFNLFFIISASVYVSLLAAHFQWSTASFVFQFLYTTMLISIVYAFKYIFLSFSGWVFNVKDATETYIFIVYLINKIIGIILIPFVLLIAFSDEGIKEVVIQVSIWVIALLFIYRYIISFTPVSKDVKVNPFHFLLYVIAFEALPLLFIYKLLANYLHGSL